MRARRRSATPAGASSARSASGRQIAAEAAAIRSIHISDAGRFGFARLEAHEQGIEAFGYVVANRALGAALWGRLSAAPELTLRVPASLTQLKIDAAGAALTRRGAAGATEHFSARLVVAADGAHSQVRAAAGIDADGRGLRAGGAGRERRER